VNQVIIVTGPAGAGKSSVAEAICERFDRMMHIEVDHLRHWVKAGYRHPWLDDPQTAEQRLLAVRNASAIAREADALRYAAVIDDVVLAEGVALYREAFAGIGCNVHFALLLPSLEVTLARDGQRSEPIPDRARTLHADFARESSGGLLPGAAIDSSEDGDAAMTADRVMDAVASGAALFIEGSNG
jgi:chloramphenicol 3-O-phosphotransferase